MKASTVVDAPRAPGVSAGTFLVRTGSDDHKSPRREARARRPPPSATATSTVPCRHQGVTTQDCRPGGFSKARSERGARSSGRFDPARSRDSRSSLPSARPVEGEPPHADFFHLSCGRWQPDLILRELNKLWGSAIVTTAATPLACVAAHETARHIQM